MQSVTVITPKARRQVVKVEPNKTVLSILEFACQKQNLSPDLHGLKHHNKIVDLSQSFRFSGIPNNATLEMIELEVQRIDKKSTICLQLPDNSRVSGEFLPTATIREILKSLSPDHSAPELSSVVIYMRNEIHGDSLDTTTLKSLGLSSGGRALMRLMLTDPESLKVQANISKPLPSKPREESPVRQANRATGAASNTTQAGPSSAISINDIKRVKHEADKKIETSAVEPMETEAEIPEPEKPQLSATVSKTEPSPEPPRDPEPEPVINILDDRGTIIFSLESMSRSQMDLPDSFFDLTESEIRNLYRDLKNHVDDLDNRPLMTAQLRKLEENKKILNQLSIYKTCAIRVQMPDRHVIQTKFSTVSKVSEVMVFLKTFLVDPDQEFYLFLTPPKTILDPSSTLIEAGAVPSALLHFGTDQAVTETGCQVKSEFLEKLSTGSGASRVLIANEASGSSEAGSSKKPTVPNNFMTSKACSSGTSVPKWFKTGK